MARLEVQGFDELNDAFRRAGDIPFETCIHNIKHQKHNWWHCKKNKP